MIFFFKKRAGIFWGVEVGGQENLDNASISKKCSNKIDRGI